MTVRQPMARRRGDRLPLPEATALIEDTPRLAARGVSLSLVVTLALFAMSVAYAAFFIYLSWWRFDRFLTHALDLGNMEQAAWNTAHGHPFHFTNLRIKMQIEASGTATRLSFHVEPIFLLVAIPYLFISGPLVLMIVQTLVVVTGVVPTALLARRYLGSTVAQIVFPLIYLLYPALEAANLYEFHPVTMSAALLLWAFYVADGRRYRLFAIFGILAMSTKEEIGLVVAAMALWLWWRHRDRTIGLTAAILAAGWSLFCVLVIERHFGSGHSSPYCARFNPYIINGHGADTESKITTCTGVVKVILQHPDQLLSILVMPQKLGFLHRIFMPAGYLSLLSPLTLAISLPSYAVILFSNDVHMYSGLGHYAAELVPLLIVSAILGTAWATQRLAPLLHVRPDRLVLVACLWLLVASLANQRVNGFTPLADGFSLPSADYHVQVGHRIVAEIPANASVAAGDYLNDYVSDRRNVYLFPSDFNDATYIAADVSRDNFPYAPSDEYNIINCLLHGTLTSATHRCGGWGIVDAADGYVLLRRQPLAGQGHPLPTTLPPAFYTFVVPTTSPTIAHPMIVHFGPSLQLVGYNLERREQVNLRQPDIVLTTYWRLSTAVTQPITPVDYLTNGSGAIDGHFADAPALDWLPMTRWPVGKIVVLTSVPMTVFTNENGKVDVDLAVFRPETCGYYASVSRVLKLMTPLACDLLQDAHVVDPAAPPPPATTFRYRPDVRWTPQHAPLEVVASGTILKLAQVPAVW